MFDVNNYISSGIVEQYCLGLTTVEESAELEKYCSEYPEIRVALLACQDALLAFNAQLEKDPPLLNGSKILNSIEELKFNNIEFYPETNTVSEFIGISQYSNLEKWQELIQHIPVPHDYENIYHQDLYIDNKKRSILVWVKKEVPAEIHQGTDEKFLILEGTCTCILGDEKINMVPGSFLQIPLNVSHNIVVTSDKPVKAIITKEKAA